MCSNVLCGACDKQVSQKGLPIKCFNCNVLFHQRCCLISTFCYKKLIEKNIDWFCEDCNSITFPFSNVTNLELADLFKDNDDQIQPSRKSKCNFCLKKVKQNVSFAHCGSCSCFYHLACMNLKKKDFPLNKNWECSQCTLKTLPFSHVSEEEMLLWSHGLSIWSLLWSTAARSNYPVGRCYLPRNSVHRNLLSRTLLGMLFILWIWTRFIRWCLSLGGALKDLRP